MVVFPVAQSAHFATTGGAGVCFIIGRADSQRIVEALVGVEPSAFGFIDLAFISLFGFEQEDAGVVCSHFYRQFPGNVFSQGSLCKEVAHFDFAAQVNLQEVELKFLVLVGRIV